MKTAVRMAIVVLVLVALGATSATMLSLSRPIRSLPAADRRSATDPCPAEEPSSPAGMVAGWRLAGIDFLSARRGVGVIGGSGCAGAQLAVSTDAGARWRLVGHRAPAPAVRIVALSARAVWLLTGDGRLETTNDAGAHWAMPAVPNPTLALVAQDGWVDALGCPPISDASCRPTLTGTRSPGGPWQLMALPAPRSLLPPVLAGAGGSTLLFAAFDVHTAAIRLWVSDDGGRRWSARRAPTWDGHRCTGPATMMAAAGRRAWWLLCLGNAGAGTSTKALERSADGGKRWQIVSAAPAPGTISSGEPTALAAGDSQHLWLALANGVLESRDGGVRWSGVPGITPQDRPTELDVLSGRRAWLLVSGAGLWRTRDGWHWRRLGPQRG